MGLLWLLIDTEWRVHIDSRSIPSQFNGPSQFKVHRYNNLSYAFCLVGGVCMNLARIPQFYTCPQDYFIDRRGGVSWVILMVLLLTNSLVKTADTPTLSTLKPNLNPIHLLASEAGSGVNLMVGSPRRIPAAVPTHVFRAPHSLTHGSVLVGPVNLYLWLHALRDRNSLQRDLQ
jgi:hypothetical protein